MKYTVTLPEGLENLTDDQAGIVVALVLREREAQPPPPAATSDKDEREHCERAVSSAVETSEVGREFCQALVKLVLTERTAADKAGFERGRAEGEQQAINDSQHCIQLQHRIITERTAQLTATQTELKELRAAALAYLHHHDGTGYWDGAEANLRAALAAKDESGVGK